MKFITLTLQSVSKTLFQEQLSVINSKLVSFFKNARRAQYFLGF